MFKHIFVTRLRCCLRDKSTLFWTSVFPLVLATLFWLALGNISNEAAFSSIPLAVVNDTGYQTNLPLRSALQAASQGDKALFAITAVDDGQAQALLLDGKVSGVLRVQGQDLSLSFRSSGIRQSIIKEFADTFLQMSSAYTDIIAENPSSALKLTSRAYSAVPVGDAEDSAKMDLIANYFFALIAMACMYGGFQGIRSVLVTMPNQSAVAVRNALAPVRRITVFSASFLAAALIQFISVMALYLYIALGIGVDFGPRGGLILLTCALSTIMGVGMGALISALFKKKEGLMVAVLLSVSMAGSFLAGMMVSDIKYIVQTHVPILSYINPVNLIADALYALYLYPTLDRFVLNFSLIGAFTFIFLGAVSLLMRRPKYASI